MLHRSDHRRTQRRASLAAVLTATAALVVLPACSDETPRVAAPTATTTTTEPAPPDPAGPAPQALLDQCPAITELHDDLRGGALVDSATIGPVVRAFAQALHDHAYEQMARSIDAALAGEMAAEYNALQLASSWCASPPS